MERILQFIRDEEGATAVEYGLIVGLIAAAIITVVATLGDNIAALFQTIADEVGDATPAE
ncbi:Flp family type IVb pilin [Desulfoglaeba alkanexedens]|uniref:Flp family type IVb pilin n=1 Tax=Desulfoglaeba alkanexedens ALDC TaxID=980445 RepID=A0A4V1ERV5_9BACT|nr:Flp family type IVb pilin [Desulfoglaeba alkanexedens]QCQ22961.1 Flp family type IVb pilin [Desulfoglaeba alkanexedens ALDC]